MSRNLGHGGVAPGDGAHGDMRVTLGMGTLGNGDIRMGTMGMGMWRHRRDAGQ